MRLSDPATPYCRITEKDFQSFVHAEKQREADGTFPTYLACPSLLPTLPSLEVNSAEQCASLGVAKFPQIKQLDDRAGPRGSFDFADRGIVVPFPFMTVGAVRV